MPRKLLFQFTIFFILLFAGQMVGSAIAYLLSPLFQVDPASLTDPSLHSANPEFIMISVLLNHLVGFIAPALIFFRIFYRDETVHFLGTGKWPDLRNFFLSCLFFIAALPLVYASYKLNQYIVYSEWVTAQEDVIHAFLKEVLTMDNPWQLIRNLLLIAALPALSEELVFRGVIQNMTEKITRSGHLAVWIAAILFSAIHLQFLGFLPRLLLGAALGYVYLWTRNFWVPVLIHFFNNALQVIAVYIDPDQLPTDMQEEVPDIPLYLPIISLVILYFLYRLIQQSAQRADQGSE